MCHSNTGEKGEEEKEDQDDQKQGGMSNRERLAKVVADRLGHSQEQLSLPTSSCLRSHTEPPPSASLCNTYILRGFCDK